MYDFDSAKSTVFIDESGNNGFDFNAKNVSSHYVITAIIIETKKLATVREEADKIRVQRYGINGEIKSSRCTSLKMRFEILSNISELDFTICTLVVDKTKLYDGSKIRAYKDTVFYPYLNKLLYLQLKAYKTDMAIFADEYKDKEFMERFSKYIDEEFPRTLIDKNSFEFKNSKEEVVIQVADFIAGSIAFNYETNKKCQEAKGFLGLLRDKMLLIPWPNPDISERLKFIKEGKFDKVVAEYCISSTTKYIQQYQLSENEQHIDQLIILNYLLNEIYLHDPSKYVYINQLTNNLENRTGRKYTKQTFISQIIAPMRDDSVIISGGSDGLKIPLTAKELFAYTDHTLRNTIPGLDRLEKARKEILLATNYELDIICDEKYKRIQKYME